MKTPNLYQEKFHLVMLALIVSIGLSLVSFVPGWALGPPRPGEIEQLKTEGKYEQRLQNAIRIGNHLANPALAHKLKQKILRLRGMTAADGPPLAQALPPARQGGLKSIGSPKIFALLIEFNDMTASHSADTINNMVFGPEDTAKIPWDTLAAYYKRSSYGLLNLEGATLGWYKTTYDRSAVAETDAGRESLIKEALNHFDTSGTGHDFSQYDNDGDGDIDYFLVMWAGPDTGWATFWWQYSSSWTDGTYTLDGKKLSRYTWQPVVDDPHIVLHETGHALGLPDLYDYDADVGPRCGVGSLDPMDSYRGDHNCFSKWMLDWIDPIVVNGTAMDLTLQASATSPNQCVLIWQGITAGDIFSEFFMVENKQDVGNDSNYGFTPDGLAIWHIDATLNAENNFQNNNSTTDHKLVRLMEADGLEEIESTVVPDGHICFVADAGDLYSSGNQFGPATMPSSKKYDGSDSCVRVLNIADLGTDKGAPIVATFSALCNQPPVASAGGPYNDECQGVTTKLSLNGTGSIDPDPGDILTYQWSTNCPGGSFNDPTSKTPELTVSSSSCAVACSVSLIVTDSGNLWNSASSTVIISDTLPPNITCPADKTIQCDESTDPSNTGSATATDVCFSNPAIGFSDVIVPGACLQAFQIIRTWTAVDACTNSSSCVQNTNVVDTIPPVIQCNAPGIIIPPDASISFTATATDNCSTPSVEITTFDCTSKKRRSKLESCVVDIVGSTINILNSGGVSDKITWTVRATDSCGNSSEQLCSTLVVNPGKGKK